jgi:hypothetical protein
MRKRTFPHLHPAGERDEGGLGGHGRKLLGEWMTVLVAARHAVSTISPKKF